VHHSVAELSLETSFKVFSDCVVTAPIPAAGMIPIETSFSPSFDCVVSASFYRIDAVYTACVDIITGKLSFLLREELDGYILAEDGTRIVI
jgi:hypothetical protein